MDIIFLGGFFPKRLDDFIQKHSKQQIQNAANTFQWAFINGLEGNLEKPLKLVTSPFIGWYPKYFDTCIIKTSFFDNKNQKNAGVLVGFPNLPFLKNIFKYFNIKLHLNRIILDSKQPLVIVYGLDLAYLKAAISCKRRNTKLLICAIITDLPDYPGDTSVIYKWYLQKIEKKEVFNLLHEIDCFIVVAYEIVKYLKIEDKPYRIIEGLFDIQKFETDDNINSTQQDHELKTILYTGTLDLRYGIKELLDAFNLITEKNYRLWICGGGSGLCLLKKRMEKDDRIIYYGIIPRIEISKLQKQATLLVNPRSPRGEYNRYSFPSKTIEYLASGTPTLLYKLDGIPSEYYDYCYTIEDDKIKTLADSMLRICQIDIQELNQKGNAARNFILEHKNSLIQCKKAIQMFDILLSKK